MSARREMRRTELLIKGGDPRGNFRSFALLLKQGTKHQRGNRRSLAPLPKGGIRVSRGSRLGLVLFVCGGTRL